MSIQKALDDLAIAVDKSHEILRRPLADLRVALKKVDPRKMKIGAVADLLYQLEQSAGLTRQLPKPFEEVFSDSIKMIEEFFVNKLEEGESSGVQGLISRVQINGKPVPVVNDWEKFYAHISKTKSWDLLNKAVNRDAVRARWNDKKQVPGVTTFRSKTVSCTKLARAKKGDV